ncbi:MAG: hypothetical protein M3458_05320 [Acidobacteriota bacterium]|nr:hypothetical protein [Acidobacteriota bacterium]
MTYYEYLQKLNPQYDDCPLVCPREDDAERNDYCETCEAGAQWRAFVESATGKLEKQGVDGYTFDSLYADTVRVMNINGTLYKGTYPADCTALTAKLLDIVRAEIYRPTRIFYWQLEQERNATK